MTDLLLTDDQIDHLLDALGAGCEDDPPTAEQARDFLLYAELRLREAALITGAITGRYAVRLDGNGGWEFLPRETSSAA
jgi:hypothetical protein